MLKPLELVGRVFTRGGMTYTVESASSRGEVCVWDPQENRLIRFDSRDTFNDWVYGTPVPSAGGQA